MRRHAIATLLAGSLISFATLTGCSGTEEAQSPDAPASSPTAMETEQQMNPDITAEQSAFLADLLATPLPQDDATARIEEAGYSWRLGTIDGEPQAVTMDYRLDRLTLTTQDGLVIDATWG